MRQIALIALLIALTAAGGLAADDDPYLWLEDVEGEKALAWARERSAADTAVIEATPSFRGIHEKLLEITQSRDRIPDPAIRGPWIYNFWRDTDHVRGLWRRTFPAQFVEKQPAWEVVLDLDALAEAEGENWVWKGATCLLPEGRHCMVRLSRGGADATVQREFDTAARAFEKDGFFLPEAKSQASWKDADTLWVGTDFGEGSLTESGYPRTARLWKRGTPLEEASTVFEGAAEDMLVVAYSEHTPEGRYDLVLRKPEFFTSVNFLHLGDRLVKLALQEDAELLGFLKDRVLVRLRSEWDVGGTTYAPNTLLAADLDAFLEGSPHFDVLFEPEERVSLDEVASTRNHLLYTTLDNVRGRLFRLTPGESGWTKEEIELPGMGTVTIGSTGEIDDRFFFTYEDFLTPSTLYVVRDGQAPEEVKSSPAWFDTTGMTVDQLEATASDGTRIPYFVFKPRGFVADGTRPTLLTAYGGFEISRKPTYSGAVGTAWVARGGVYVLANIRGGGEFGPKWHQAAVREKHQTNFDDFIAVAEDLVARKITSPRHLGSMGGSQGGLLVGGAFVQRPDLFNAVVCAVPLLDMKRYNKLLAGASWMSEYGNPDTEDWEFMKKWSPYQNVGPGADYPRVFFWTNTRDDRVHPGHARKMVAKMTDLGKPVLYYENTEGGHGAGANLKERAYTQALSYAYLWMMLE